MVTGYMQEIKTQSQGTEWKDRREDLNAAYAGPEEMCTGNEFQIKGALIKKEYRKAFTREGMHCSELTLQ